MFSAAFYGLATGRMSRPAVYYVLIYCCLLACLRGNSGTDTEMYQDIFTAVQLGNIEWTVEPGFALVAQLLMNVGLSPEAAVRGISVLFFALIAIYATRATVTEQWVLMAFILPVFAYQYSMNGLRIGLASAALLLCTQALRQDKLHSHLAIMLIPASLQYSALLSSAWVLIARLSSRTLHLLTGAIIVAIAFLLLWVIANEYLFAKQEIYELMVSQEAHSGMARVLVIFLLCCAILMSPLSAIEKVAAVGPAIILSVISIIVARESFAGLRLLDLISFALPVVLCACLRRSSQAVNRHAGILLLAAGLLGSAGVARNFINEAGSGAAPFAPYRTLWHPLSG